jgi:hypothetical protein
MSQLSAMALMNLERVNAIQIWDAGARSEINYLQQIQFASSLQKK